MTTSVTQLPFLGGGDNQILVASVVYANPTATAVVLNCPPGTDSNDCGYYNATVTVGPWADPTPAPDASIGAYDMLVNETGYWFYSMHCEISSMTPQVCTTTNIGGNDDGHPTSTYSLSASTDDDYGFGIIERAPVTITAGLEKLVAAARATSETTATVANYGPSTNGSGTGSAASATGTSAAVRTPVLGLKGVLAVSGLFSGWFIL